MIFASKPIVEHVIRWTYGERPVTKEVPVTEAPHHPGMYAIDTTGLEPGVILRWTFQLLGDRTAPAYAQYLGAGQFALFNSPLAAVALHPTKINPEYAK